MTISHHDVGRWSMRDVRAVFAALDCPDPAALVGAWDGALVGRRRLVRLSRAVASATPLRGWCGKVIGAGGDVQNFVYREGVTVPSATGLLAAGRSVLDGRPALVVDYSTTARLPVRWLRGELRWLSPGADVLGVLVLPLGRLKIGPFPFLLTRART